jgi:hypothetical protein
MSATAGVDSPRVPAGRTAAFAAHERALTGNDIAARIPAAGAQAIGRVPVALALMRRQRAAALGPYASAEFRALEAVPGHLP